MLQGGVGLVQEAQGDPASEKLGFDIGVARDQAVLGGNLVGDASLAGVELGASSSIFQASSSRSLRRRYWMRLKRNPTSAWIALAGKASSSLPALPPLWTTAMRAATFFWSSAESSFATRSAEAVADLSSG